jgi:hypothetical protein
MKNLVFVAIFALGATLTSCETKSTEPVEVTNGTEDSTKVQGHSEHATVTTPSVDSVKTETKTEKK